MRFQNEQMEAAYKLEVAGNAVISCVYSVPNSDNSPTEEEIKMFGKMHKAKIDISDAIFVVNVGGYIGNSTKGEIEYAKKAGKEIMWLEKPKSN